MTSRELLQALANAPDGRLWLADLCVEPEQSEQRRLEGGRLYSLLFFLRCRGSVTKEGGRNGYWSVTPQGFEELDMFRETRRLRVPFRRGQGTSVRAAGAELADEPIVIYGPAVDGQAPPSMARRRAACRVGCSHLGNRTKQQGRFNVLKSLWTRAIGAAINRMIERALRTPYDHLGGYMHRYWLVQPSLWTLGMGLRVHNILRSDRDRDMHTHPWWFISLILRGAYWEATPASGGRFRGLPGAFADVNEAFQVAQRKPGSIAFRSRYSRHKVILMGGPVWTLVLTGPDTEQWGYVVNGKQYVDRRDYEHRRVA